MIIKHIKVKSFGSVQFYDTELNSNINILDTHFTAEIETAIELILCSKPLKKFPAALVNRETLIAAEVLLDESLYFVELKPIPNNERILKVAVKDAGGNDATDHYLNVMSHCTEQDTLYNFDGHDNSYPLRLCRNGDRDDREAPNELCRSNYIVDTKTFRSHLKRYIKCFKPEPINNKKNYKTSINKQGKFEVTYPGISGEIHLSETEEKLFRYICFLNVVEFWEDVETTRDMHHKKRPLVIKNFLEFLDQSTDMNGLILRTVQLGRQVIILTLPIRQDVAPSNSVIPTKLELKY